MKNEKEKPWSNGDLTPVTYGLVLQMSVEAIPKVKGFISDLPQTTMAYQHKPCRIDHGREDMRNSYTTTIYLRAEDQATLELLRKAGVVDSLSRLVRERLAELKEKYLPSILEELEQKKRVLRELEDSLHYNMHIEDQRKAKLAEILETYAERSEKLRHHFPTPESYQTKQISWIQGRIDDFKEIFPDSTAEEIFTLMEEKLESRNG